MLEGAPLLVAVHINVVDVVVNVVDVVVYVVVDAGWCWRALPWWRSTRPATTSGATAWPWAPDPSSLPWSTPADTAPWSWENRRKLSSLRSHTALIESYPGFILYFIQLYR